MEKRKHGDTRSQEKKVLDEAFAAPAGTDDAVFSAALLREAKEVFPLLQKRKDKLIGTATTFILFAILRMVRYFPDHAKAYLASQNELILIIASITVFGGMYEGLHLASALGKLRAPMGEVRKLCALLGIPEADLKKVLREVGLKEAEILAKAKAGLIEVDYEGNVIVRDGNKEIQLGRLVHRDFTVEEDAPENEFTDDSATKRLKENE